jgi:hypothetical protein
MECSSKKPYNVDTHCEKWVVLKNPLVDSKTTFVKWQVGVQQ